MAVAGVWSELVSAVASLSHRENAGKFFEIGSSGGSRAKIPERFQRRGDRFPVNRKGVRFRRAGKSRKSIPFFKPS
jgi:hypothetical protein